MNLRKSAESAERFFPPGPAKLLSVISLIGLMMTSYWGCKLPHPHPEPPPCCGCEYIDIPGQAEIVSVLDANTADYNCPNDPVEVTFNFIPDDPLKVDSYLHPEVGDTLNHLTISGGMNPPRTWVLEQGLLEGSTHDSVRREIISGSCTPVLFEFPDLDYYSHALDICY